MVFRETLPPPSFNPPAFLSTLSFLNPNMDEVLSEWKKLSLTDEEGAKLSLTKSKNLRRKEYVIYMCVCVCVCGWVPVSSTGKVSDG